MLFDCHNHLHLSQPHQLEFPSDVLGCALQSTCPKDWPIVLNQASSTVVPCVGVHPWFLPADDDDDDDDHDAWLHELDTCLNTHTQAAVGEIGLDRLRGGKHQLPVFTAQWQLAVQHQRPVSVHNVHATGMWLDFLHQQKKKQQAPPAVYFHAFGEKAGTVRQIRAALSQTAVVYFGFAPAVNNLQGTKAMHSLREIGLSGVVLETDRSQLWDTLVRQDLYAGAEWIADVLDCSVSKVIDQTYTNSLRLYGLD